MNVLLKHIEQHVTEQALVKAEAILALEEVNALEEVEKHLWRADVQACEVEVQITPSKIKAYSCDCRQAEICGHVTAVLLILRKKITIRQEKAKQRRVAKLPTKLTIPHILQEAELQNLKEFVRSYARADRHFAIALKAHFASQITLPNTQEKYSQLLQSIIPSLQLRRGKVNNRNAQQLLKTVQTLLNHADEHLANANFSEAFAISQSIIHTIMPWLPYTKKQQTTLIESLMEAIGLITQLTQQKRLAPALKEDIWQYCLATYQQLHIFKLPLGKALADILLTFANDKPKAKQLLPHTEQLLSQPSYLLDAALHTLLYIQITLLCRLRASSKLVNILAPYTQQNPSALLAAIQYLADQPNWTALKRATKAILSHPIPPDLQDKLEGFLLQAAEHQNDTKAISKYAKKRYLATYQLPYYQTYKAAQAEQWPTHLQQLIKQLQETNTPSATQAIATIYTQEGNYQALLQHLQQQQSLPLLQQYSHHLLPVHPKATGQLYHALLVNYLNNHLGRQPSIQVRRLIHQLNKNGAHQLASQLVATCRTQYAERHSLLEELQLFP